MYLDTHTCFSICLLCIVIWQICRSWMILLHHKCKSYLDMHFKRKTFSLHDPSLKSDQCYAKTLAVLATRRILGIIRKSYFLYIRELVIHHMWSLFLAFLISGWEGSACTISAKHNSYVRGYNSFVSIATFNKYRKCLLDVMYL